MATPALWPRIWPRGADTPSSSGSAVRLGLLGVRTIRTFSLLGASVPRWWRLLRGGRRAGGPSRDPLRAQRRGTGSSWVRARLLSIRFGASVSGRRGPLRGGRHGERSDAGFALCGCWQGRVLFWICSVEYSRSRVGEGRKPRTGAVDREFCVGTCSSGCGTSRFASGRSYLCRGRLAIGGSTSLCGADRCLAPVCFDRELAHARGGRGSG